MPSNEAIGCMALLAALAVGGLLIHLSMRDLRHHFPGIFSDNTARTESIRDVRTSL